MDTVQQQKHLQKLLGKLSQKILNQLKHVKVRRRLISTYKVIIKSNLVSEILGFVASGQIGLAIEKTTQSYPGLLEANLNLLFMLKCRQFIEMINGTDVSKINSNVFI